MCTCVSFKAKDHYFGRNLDLDHSYQESVTVMPRRYELSFRNGKKLEEHFAMIGMAFVLNDYPLYYDGVNEYGLAMAGLNFPDNCYFEKNAGDGGGRDVVAPFEFIPWILAQCRDLSEARGLIDRLILADIPYAENLPVNPLHFMISDKTSSIVVEPLRDGLHIYDNPVGVMTNNPTFDYQLLHLAEFRNVTPEERGASFGGGIEMPRYCAGMGGIGLPGDLSSPSRFVKAAFTKLNSECDETEGSAVSQFFHILGSVEMQRGCCRLADGGRDITIYSSCMNQEKGVYYVKTYDSFGISAADMHHEDLDGTSLSVFPLPKYQELNMLN
ncbi:MAG: choloylglycine hydrolase [Eubacterium sp.]|jgi:choloylglycine hydrolase